VNTYSTKVLEDEEGPFVILPDELSRELAWGVGATLRITGDRNCFKIELLEKGVQQEVSST